MTPARRFAYRLALALGEPNPDAMLARLPFRIFKEWLDYAQVEPFGEERADLRAGIIASVMANCLARGKGRPAFRPSDFMPLFDGEKRERTPDELFQKVKALNWLFGGSFEDKREPPVAD